jgi:hypothetical protein
MNDRFRRLRVRRKAGRLVTYWQDRLTGRVFATSQVA